MIQKWGGGCLVVLMILSLAGFGLQGLYVAATNRQPVSIRCSEISGKPRSLWVNVSGAFGLVTEAVYKEKNAVIDELFIPLRCEGDQPGDRARMVLATKDPVLRKVMTDLLALGKGGTPARLQAYLERQRDRLVVRREISALVRSGLDDDEGVQRELGRLAQKDLRPGFFVLDDGASPPLLRSLLMLAGAAALAFFYFRPRTGAAGAAPVPVYPPARR